VEKASSSRPRLRRAPPVRWNKLPLIRLPYVSPFWRRRWKRWLLCPLTNKTQLRRRFRRSWPTKKPKAPLRRETRRDPPHGSGSDRGRRKGGDSAAGWAGRSALMQSGANAAGLSSVYLRSPLFKLTQITLMGAKCLQDVLKVQSYGPPRVYQTTASCSLSWTRGSRASGPFHLPAIISHPTRPIGANTAGIPSPVWTACLRSLRSFRNSAELTSK
jgi:hypothetical protein